MKLLKELYEIHSPSYGEKKMRKFIRKWIRENVPDALITTDNRGNILVVRGDSDTYPCIVAHTDQVQDKHESDFAVCRSGDNLFGWSPSAMRMRGLGADDKNGIWVALKCLEKYDVMKCAFFMGEEVGCVGSNAVKMSWFDDCRWVVQCDRKNAHDLITVAGGTDLCSVEFFDALQGEQFGYKETSGLMTDVMTLKDRGLKVSCVNMSCGYYRPHTDEEYTNMKDLQNCLDFVMWIVENVTDVYPHEYVPKKWGGYGGYGRYYDDWYDKVIDSRAYDDDMYMSDTELRRTIEQYVRWYPEMTDEELYDELHWFTRMPKKELLKLIADKQKEIWPTEDDDDLPSAYANNADDNNYSRTYGSN